MLNTNCYGGLVCGRCDSGDEHPIIVQKIEEDGDTVYRHSCAICQNCGELLGETEVFHRDHIYIMDREKVKKTLDKLNKV